MNKLIPLHCMYVYNWKCMYESICLKVYACICAYVLFVRCTLCSMCGENMPKYVACVFSMCVQVCSMYRVCLCI